MMKKFSLFFICLFFVVSCSDYNTENVPTTQSSSSQSSQSSSAPAYPLVDEDGRNLVWHDEFEGTNLDTAKWIVETGVHVNNELQDYKASGNHQVTNGHLIITARYETSGGYNYTSARVKTDGKFNFTYGHVVARILLPSGDNGTWPAFWMLGDYATYGWADCGELDIMEYAGSRPDQASSAIHWDPWPSNQYQGDLATIDDDTYHTYAVKWNSTSIKWIVDGNLQHTYDISNAQFYAFRRAMFIIINFAVGGDFTGTPDPTNYQGSGISYLIDYVRVYQ